MAKTEQKNARHKERVELLLTNPSLLKAYPCDECNFACATEKELKLHFDEAHSAQAHEKPKQKWWLYNVKRQCDQCDYFGFNMQRHMEHHHDPNLPHGCDHCGYRALTSKAITLHISNHHTKKQHHCSLGCGKSFKDPWYLKRHEERLCVNAAVKEKCKKGEEAIGNAGRDKANQKLWAKARNKKYEMLKLKREEEK